MRTKRKLNNMDEHVRQQLEPAGGKAACHTTADLLNFEEFTEMIDDFYTAES